MERLIRFTLRFYLTFLIFKNIRFSGKLGSSFDIYGFTDILSFLSFISRFSGMYPLFFEWLTKLFFTFDMVRIVFQWELDGRTVSIIIFTNSFGPLQSAWLQFNFCFNTFLKAWLILIVCKETFSYTSNFEFNI